MSHGCDPNGNLPIAGPQQRGVQEGPGAAARRVRSAAGAAVPEQRRRLHQGRTAAQHRPDRPGGVPDVGGALRPTCLAVNSIVGASPVLSSIVF